MPNFTPMTNRRTINPVRSAKDQAKKSQAKNSAINRPIVPMPDSATRLALTKQELNRKRPVTIWKEHAPTPPNATRQPFTLQKSRQQSPLVKKQGAALRHNRTETGQQIRQRAIRWQRGRRK
jgi:hypothetical protein